MFAVIALLGTAAPVATPSPPFEIDQIEPVIFDRESGQLVPFPREHDLPNAEGDLGVRVRIVGGASYAKDVTLHVDASVLDDAGKPKGKPIAWSQTLGETGREKDPHYRFVPLTSGWLCGSVKVSAHITGQKHDSKKELTIPTECGD